MFLIVCEDENGPELTTYSTSIFRISGTYCSPTLFFCMSLVDIMTLLQKKNYQNLGILFSGICGQRSRSMTFVTLFLQTAMPCICLVRAMSQLHFKTNISSLSQLGTKLCLIT